MLRIKQKPEQFVPLQRVSVAATIRSFAADVSVTQLFRNDETTPIEAVYCFPIEEQAAVYGFVARIDGREITAQLEEKQVAQKEYSDALRQGHGAYLLEQDEKSQDNFIINVGALPPGKECQILISYVTELQLVENGTKIRFVVPTTIAPRYNPEKGELSASAGTTFNYVQSSPYTIDFRCQVEKVGIAAVSSLSHPIQVGLGEQEFYMITFAQQNTHLDRDILLDAELTGKRSNTILAVEPGAVMAAFTPNEADCQRAVNNAEITNEFIFVVDCSASMYVENKIELARQAMLLFLKSLPVECYFNIVRFGSTHQVLFKEITVLYNEENAHKAKQLSKSMTADLVGTELLSPLQWLEQNPPARGRARQIFLLTDGEISNVAQVLDLCRTMASSTRIFSFGVGSSPSRALVKGLARATNGRFVFIPPKTSVDVYVGEQLQKALQPCIINVRVHWHLGTTALTTVPTVTPPVYASDRLIVYALVDQRASGFDPDSKVELRAGQCQLGEAKVTQIPSVSDHETIARLAAKALILELQHAKLPSSEQTAATGSLQARFQEHQQTSTTATDDETAQETTKKRIVELSLKYNILSPHTAFVGVEKRANGSNADMTLREVPIQISTDAQLLTSYAMSAPIVSSRYSRGNSPSTQSSLQRSVPIASSSSSRDNSPSTQSLVQRSISAVSGWFFGSNAPTVYESSVERQVECSRRFASSACEVADDGSISRRKYSPRLDESDDDDSSSSSDSADPSMANNSGANTILSESDARDHPTQTEDVWPTNDQDIVRYLIQQQKFNGAWDFDTNQIQQLTGKPLTDFQQPTSNKQVLVSAIVIAMLETRFAPFTSMWHGVVRKARKRLVELLGKDVKKLDALLDELRQQL